MENQMSNGHLFTFDDLTPEEQGVVLRFRSAPVLGKAMILIAVTVQSTWRGVRNRFVAQ